MVRLFSWLMARTLGGGTKNLTNLIKDSSTQGVPVKGSSPAAPRLQAEDPILKKAPLPQQTKLSATLSESVSADYVPFENRQRIIQDVIDEMWDPQPIEEDGEEEDVQYFPRGKTGVFDLGTLVDLLRSEHAEELVVITMPKEIDYADYMVIVTVRNKRHVHALATFVRKRFKMTERKRSDILPVLDKKKDYEGWIALDLGNIILHIFLQDVRDYYDLEMLWTVGPVFDDLFNTKDPEIVQLLNTIK